MDRTRVLLVDDEKTITSNLLAVILPRIRRQRERAEHVPAVPPVSGVALCPVDLLNSSV